MTSEQKLRDALRRAFNLGQTYWQLADSRYTSQHRKADETRRKFDALVEETVGGGADRDCPASDRCDKAPNCPCFDMKGGQS
jgi:hypothetical protein